MNINRRNVILGAAWTAPFILIAKEAPAFAMSATECTAVGWVKDPGKGHASKDYHVLVSCEVGEPKEVLIYDDVAEVHRKATKQSDGSWAAFGFNDSRRNRLVTIDAKYQFMVAFPPRKS